MTSSSYKNILLDNSWSFEYPPDIYPTPVVKSIETPKVSKMATPDVSSNSISTLEKFIDEQYENNTKVKDTQSVKLEPKASNNVDKSNETNNFYFQPQFNNLLINSFQIQIENLKSEIYFLRGEMKEKNSMIKHLLQMNSSLKSNNDYNNLNSKMNEILNELNKTIQSNVSSTPRSSVFQEDIRKTVPLRYTINDDGNGISDKFCNDKNIKNANIADTAANNLSDKANNNDNINDKADKSINNKANNIDNITDKANNNINDKANSINIKTDKNNPDKNLGSLNNNGNNNNNPFSHNPFDNQHLSSINPCSSVNFNDNNITHRNRKKLIPNKIVNSNIHNDHNDNNDNDIDKCTDHIDFDINSTKVIKNKINNDNASKDSTYNDINDKNNNNINSNTVDSKDKDKNKYSTDINITEQKKDDENKIEKLVNQERKTVYIVGDSMIKELKGFELAKSIHHRKQVKVRSHPSAQIRCITDHIQPIIRSADVDHIVLHIGTNDLKKEKTPIQICHEIINLASKARDKGIKVSISSIIQRNDHLNEKVLLVNDYLQKMCTSIGIKIINNGNIRPDTHLNASKLHLNRKGNNILISNIRGFLKSI